MTTQLLYQPAQPAEPALCHGHHQTQTSSSGPVLFSAPWSVGSITTSPFPQPQIPNPSQAPVLRAVAVHRHAQHFKPAYTIQWTLSVQHQFGHGWQAQLDYIGNRRGTIPLAPAQTQPYSYPRSLGCGRHGLHGHRDHGPSGGEARRGRNQLLYHRKPELSPSSHYRQPRAGQSNSGWRCWVKHCRRHRNRQLQRHGGYPQHRMSNTFSLLANWTWSKCLDIEDGQGDLASHFGRESQQSAGGLRSHAASTIATSKMCCCRQEQLQLGSTALRSSVANNWEIAPLIHIHKRRTVNVTIRAGQLPDRRRQRSAQLGAGSESLCRGEVPRGKYVGEANREYLEPRRLRSGHHPGRSAWSHGRRLQRWAYGNIGKNAFRDSEYAAIRFADLAALSQSTKESQRAFVEERAGAAIPTRRKMAATQPSPWNASSYARSSAPTTASASASSAAATA
jgi:hypothetical protein